MRRLLFLFLLLLLPRVAMAQLQTPPGFIPPKTVSQLPVGVPPGTVRMVTDGASATDCGDGEGSTRVFCEFDGNNWGARGGGAEADTLDTAHDRGNTITGATEANPLQVCDTPGATCGDIYVHSSKGFIIEANPAANVRQRIQTDKTGGFYDVEGDADVLVVDPDLDGAGLGRMTVSSGHKVVGANRGTNVGSLAGDVSSPAPVNGDIWYNSTSNKFRCRENTATVDCVGSGGVAPVIRPYSAYHVSGACAFDIYNSQEELYIADTATLLTADCIQRLRFQLPMVLPTGTLKALVTARANSVANNGAFAVKWSVTAPEADEVAVADEGTQTMTWAAGDAHQRKETKVTLDAVGGGTITAGYTLAMDFTIVDASHTLAVESGWRVLLIWE